MMPASKAVASEDREDSAGLKEGLAEVVGPEAR